MSQPTSLELAKALEAVALEAAKQWVGRPKSVKAGFEEIISLCEIINRFDRKEAELETAVMEAAKFSPVFGSYTENVIETVRALAAFKSERPARQESTR